ncbi:MAG: CapA family protein [Ignavibacteriaceae bacterium]|nr:CapA family protein [Ignavibacteriaceae bacterium]
MLGENVYHQGRGIRTNFINDYRSIIDEKVWSILLGDVLNVIYNFEYSLVPSLTGLTFEEKLYSGYAGSLDLFSDRQQIACVANNHFAQHGRRRCDFTLDQLHERNISVCGLHPGPTTIRDKDKNYKLWNCSFINENYFDGAYWLVDQLTLTNHFKDQFKADDDFWVLSLHWGNEYEMIPSITQREIAHSMIDLGVDLIIGHHPHVVQGLEIYKGKYIFYSLGNFIFDQNFSELTQIGLSVKMNHEYYPSYKLYFTRQENYVVKSIEETTIDYLNINNDEGFILSYNTKINPQSARKAMKYEYLLNIFGSDIDVIKYLLKKSFIPHRKKR